MSAVDCPPGGGRRGQTTGELVARVGSYRLARFSLLFALVLGGLTWVVAYRNRPPSALVVVVPFLCSMIAFVGYAVRTARVRVDSEGVRWGWGQLGFRMGREQLQSVTVFDNAVLFRTRRSSWFVVDRDWDEFRLLAHGLALASIDFMRENRRAPVRAHFQSYGLVLDTLLVMNCVLVVLALVLAAAGHN